MNYLTWQNINKDIAKFIELFVLPNTLAFTLAKLYFDDIEIQDSYKVFYNTIRNLFNIIDEDKNLIFKITRQILYVKYGLEFESINPIKLKKIN
ncbi:MAG: hypothetical protein OSJ70_05390 [Bacilli bacterium]|nr:hypothetical protein [Bacilli bacterium]